MANVTLTMRISGMNRVAAALDVLARIPWLFLPLIILVGSKTTAEMVGRFLIWLFVDMEVTDV